MDEERSSGTFAVSNKNDFFFVCFVEALCFVTQEVCIFEASPIDRVICWIATVEIESCLDLGSYKGL